MPGLDGPSLCKRVREELRGDYVYILLLTQHGDPASVARGLAAGANDFATKPFDPVDLRARLDNAKRLVLLHDQLASSRQLLGAGDARTLLDDVHRRARTRRRGYGVLTASPDAAARLRNATRDGDLVVAFDGRMVVVAEGVGEAEWAEMASRLAARAAGTVGMAFYDGIANEPFAAVLARAVRGKPAR